MSWEKFLAVDNHKPVRQTTDPEKQQKPGNDE